MRNEEAMVGRTLKQAIIATVLSGFWVAVTGCTSMMPNVEPTPVATKPQPTVVRAATAPKIVKQKKVASKKVILPVEEEPEAPPPVIPAAGGGGGAGGSGGGSTGGGGGNWGGG